MSLRRIVSLTSWIAAGLAVSACGAASTTTGAAAGDAPGGLAIARIDTEDDEVRSATRERALAALPRCEGVAGDRPTGHLELSIEVDPGGDTLAGILHTTFRRDELAECLARALTGVKLPTRGAAYRVRLRVEGR